jgi:hypothetical protein
VVGIDEHPYDVGLKEIFSSRAENGIYSAWLE